jgi:HAD superfamily hydrolase (TIGR01509 family)
VLLDFDGPICNVFAGIPATRVTDHLRNVLTTSGATVPDRLVRTSGPFETLRFAAALDPDLALQIEHELRTAELEAVRTAAPTPGAKAVLCACRTSGRPAAIVSNNSTAAITAYLELHALGDVVRVVAGRTSPDPGLLKPNPHLVLTALRTLGAQATDCVLVGDSETDIEAARAVGVRCIGYANKPGKRARLAGAGADAVIEDMNDFAHQLAIQ